MLGGVAEDGLAPVLVPHLVRALQIELRDIGKGQLNALGSDRAELVLGAAVVLPSVLNLWGRVALKERRGRVVCRGKFYLVSQTLKDMRINYTQHKMRAGRGKVTKGKENEEEDFET